MIWFLRALGRFAPFRHVVDFRGLDKETLTTCPACGASILQHATPFAHLDRYGFPVQTMWCRACDLLFLNPRPTSAAYKTFYDAGAYRRLITAFSGREDDHLLPQERVRQLALLLKAYVPDRPLSVLNIGGTRADYEILATHISIGRYVCLNPGESEAGEGYEVVPATLEAYIPQGDIFDVICLFGTLNHLTEPGDAFKKIYQMTGPTSAFVLDFKDPVAKMARMTQPIGGLQFDHAVYPTRRTLGVMLDAAGLTLRTWHTDNQRLYTFIAARGADRPLPEVLKAQESPVIEAMRQRAERGHRRLAIQALRTLVWGRS